MIKASEITYEYIRRDENGNVVDVQTALSHVNLFVKKGEFIAIVGRNGSGKSTLAKNLNAVLFPKEGTIYVDGTDTKDLRYLYDIRKNVGMVFQNPDNQIIATTVEEDVAFGPENLGKSSEKIRESVETSLKAVGMIEQRFDSIDKLSGGQKQKVAIAGVLAMEPQCIVLDEATDMLDPKGRDDVIQTAHKLNKEKGITIIMITHYMDEVVYADRVIVMNHAKVCMSGSPKDIFSRVDEIREIGLGVPFTVRIAEKLRKKNIPIRKDIIFESELIEELDKALIELNINKGDLNDKNFNQYNEKLLPHKNINIDLSDNKNQSSIVFNHVGFTYSPGTIYQKEVLKDINLSFYKGEFVGVVGQTGSGKTTLIQHLNGILKPTSGSIFYDGYDISDKRFSLRHLRRKVGVSFQYPEHQFLETTVYDDVSYGPRNLKWDEDKIKYETLSAMKIVGLKEDCFDLSPFNLSGGQKRRVVIAGVLAMDPEYLVFDEPTAGLDSTGKDEILNQIAKIVKERRVTAIIVSHDMDDIAKYVDRLIIIYDGKIKYNGKPVNAFSNNKELEQIGLTLPKVSAFMKLLGDNGYPKYPCIIKEEDAIDIICSWFN